MSSNKKYLAKKSRKKMASQPSRTKWYKRRPALAVKIIPHPQEMDKFEEQQLPKGRPAVKKKLNDLGWLVAYIPKPIKNTVSKAFSKAKTRILSMYDSAKKTLKDIVEKEADLTPQEHERALKGAYKSFMIPWVPKTDIDSYVDQVIPCIKTLIEDPLKEMQSEKVIITL